MNFKVTPLVAQTSVGDEQVLISTKRARPFVKKKSRKKSIGKYFFELGQVGDPSISLINSLYFIREIRPKSPKIGHPPTFVGSKKYFPVKKKFLFFFSVEQLVVYFLFRYFIAPTDLSAKTNVTLKFIDPPPQGVLK